MSSEAPERLLSFPLMAAEEKSRLRASLARAFRRQPSHITDEELLARARNRDLAALEALYDRYSRLIFGIGNRIVRDAGEAEDLVQEFFLQLCRREHSFDPAKGSARTWMVQVAYRQAMARRAYLSKRSFYAGTNPGSPQNAIEEGLNLEELVATRLAANEFLRALDNLVEQQRRVLRLYFFDGYELREIAERIGESFENVRHYYYRGLDRLRKIAAERGLEK